VYNQNHHRKAATKMLVLFAKWVLQKSENGSSFALADACESVAPKRSHRVNQRRKSLT
jgi:hypothetical protein